MTDETNSKSIKPHIILAVIVICVVVIGFFTLSGGDDPEEIPEPKIEAPIPDPIVDVIEQQEIDEYAVEDESESMDEAPDVVDMPPPEPIPEPIDTSDAAVKTSVIGLADYEAAARLLVNDDLLRRFVVMTENAANRTIATNHQVIVPPEQKFRVYEQSDKSFIDAASFKRYTPYVDTLDSMETESLISLYEVYKPAIKDIYAEIGDPDEDFTFVLMDAINHLLDTPEVPVPIEVETDSVMYKFADDRLESLSSVQKQLLRTGPENMRRIKAKLREVKDALQ
ncbi:DUF3014 domain-containing protein [Aliiglaciecola lipolytica]|uniref:DUF3014 domain-containing protein n=1 Tax=Aliiglaciecola lipolytica E3 TaxID=1127673 RepID=K6YI16_9ALTE|nr:DUF3014 domain-containing protein [Aliiglaciecola lipolytica]GAC16263.1 hypothetical protein GLIP_3652 [Aliiglaciecola lipolytica E3]